MIGYCPDCNGFLQTEITYSSGKPLVIYKCRCGWNSLNEVVTYSDRIEYKKENNNE